MSGSIEDTEFSDGEVVAAPTTSTGHETRWQCCVGACAAFDVVLWCDYTTSQQVAWEAAYQSGLEEVPLTTPGNDAENWFVHDPTTGTERRIRRIVLLTG